MGSRTCENYCQGYTRLYSVNGQRLAITVLPCRFSSPLYSDVKCQQSLHPRLVLSLLSQEGGV